MEITKQDVELASTLAHIRIKAEDVTLYEAQLKALFNWVQELSAVNTDNVQLTNVNLSAHIRPDIPVEDEVLAQELRGAFATESNGCAKVKKVL